MINRRQFCGLLGGTVVGTRLLETVIAESKSTVGETLLPARTLFGEFSAAKVSLEQWFMELRHRSVVARTDELRQRFSRIRESSGAVLFLSASGLPKSFLEEVNAQVRAQELRIFVSPTGRENAVTTLNAIRMETEDFRTVAIPVSQQNQRIAVTLESDKRDVHGYLYTRFFQRSAMTIPLAIVLFETSRCLWDAYVCPGELSSTDGFPIPRWNDRLRRDYARLLDQTRIRMTEISRES